MSSSDSYIDKNEDEGVVGEEYGSEFNASSKPTAVFGNVTSIRPIDNMRETLILEDCGELTVTERSLQFLKDRGYILHPEWVRGSDTMNALFFVHPTSLRMLKMFPYVVIMDSTYKANRYNMPLLEMIGFTCIGKTFNIGFAFMPNTNVASYRWVLSKLKLVYDELGVHVNAIMTDREKPLIKAISQVFGDGVQHLLCWVHIRDKLLAYGLKVFAAYDNAPDLSRSFANSCWGLFSSTTEASFEERYADLKTKWRPTLIAYLEKKLLNSYKKNIVRAWTDHTLHFQTRTTNRVEGMPAVLTKILSSSQGGFNTVILSIHIQMDSQTNTLRTALKKSKTERPMKLMTLKPKLRVLFRPIRGKVSRECLDKLVDMFYDLVEEMGNAMEEDCHDYYWTECHGLPCKHRIIEAVCTMSPILLHEIHSFWQQLEWDDLRDHTLAIVPFTIEDDTGNTTMAKRRRENPEDTPLIELAPQETPFANNQYSTTLDKTQLERCMDDYEREQQRLRDNTTSSPRQARRIPRGSRNKKKATDATPMGANASPDVAAPPADIAPPGDATPLDGSHRGPPTSVVWRGVNFGIGNVESFMFPYIDDARNVFRDGHSGFRSLAEVLGRGQLEYYNIRWELQGDLIQNRDFYEVLTPSSLISFEELLDNIGHVESPCSSRYWLDMPLHGLIFSTFYQVPLVFLSRNRGSHTCLPLRTFGSDKGDVIPPPVVSIAHVGCQDRFIPVWLMDNAPIPPPPRVWYQFHHPSVDFWLHALSSKIENWKRH